MVKRLRRAARVMAKEHGGWADTLPTFLSHNNQTVVFDFEILAYDPPCTAPFRVWDLDEIKVDVCCDAVGGTAPPASCP